MIELFETICAKQGEVLNLPWHQKRLDKALEKFNIKQTINLSKVLNPPQHQHCRIKLSYYHDTFNVEYFKYTPKTIHTIKCITIDSSFDYSYKYLNRDYFHKLQQQNRPFDELLLIQNGYITDTLIANVAFYKEGKWFTPKKPLLAGTTRSRLIKDKFLIPINITQEDITDFTSFAVMNAMVGFKELKDVIIS